MANKSDIVLLTLSFPYGNQETFIETEVVYLSENYDTVYVIPSNKTDLIARKTPDNVVIIDDLTKIDKSYSVMKLFPFIMNFIRVYLFSLVYSHRKKSYYQYFKSLAHHFYSDYIKKKPLRTLIKKRKLQDAFFYDYWLLNSSLSLIDLKREGLINKLVARAHRFDLYDDIQAEKVVPFKQYKLKWLDAVFTISDFGQEYLKKQCAEETKAKIFRSYLGVTCNSLVNAQNSKLLVSCASMLKFKGIDKIVYALKGVKTDLTWVHFGDGDEFENIQNLVKQLLPNNIKVELKGFVSNKDVLAFYQDHFVTCFISLSTSEGLPVSMMEAQSYGIPIIAPNISGIPEIVNDRTGVLLSENYDLKEVSDKIDAIFEGYIDFDRNYIVDFFRQNFSAEKNYRNFIKKLKSI